MRERESGGSERMGGGGSEGKRERVVRKNGGE